MFKVMNLLSLTKLIQIILSVSILILVLIQSKSAGLSSGLKSSFSTYRSLRGVEKLVFVATIVAAILLVANSLALVVIS